jgi:hypothetical protein
MNNEAKINFLDEFNQLCIEGFGRGPDSESIIFEGEFKS